MARKIKTSKKMIILVSPYGTKMNPNFRTFALWVIILLFVVAFIMLFQNLNSHLWKLR